MISNPSKIDFQVQKKKIVHKSSELNLDIWSR